MQETRYDDRYSHEVNIGTSLERTSETLPAELEFTFRQTMVRRTCRYGGNRGMCEFVTSASGLDGESDRTTTSATKW